MATKTIIFEVQTAMVTQTCCNCGILFAVTQDFDNARLKDHQTFCCPSGHWQSYRGETEEAKLKKKLLEEAKQREFLEKQNRDLRYDVEFANRQVSAKKGQITRLKNRAARGLCPCCNQHFIDLQHHMKAQHPDFETQEEIAEVPESVEPEDGENLTAKQAAEVSGMTVGRIYQLVNNGSLPSTYQQSKKGRKSNVLIKRADIEALVAKAGAMVDGEARAEVQDA